MEAEKKETNEPFFGIKPGANKFYLTNEQRLEIKEYGGTSLKEFIKTYEEKIRNLLNKGVSFIYSIYDMPCSNKLIKMLGFSLCKAYSSDKEVINFFKTISPIGLIDPLKNNIIDDNQVMVMNILNNFENLSVNDFCPQSGKLYFLLLARIANSINTLITPSDKREEDDDQFFLEVIAALLAKKIIEESVKILSEEAKKNMMHEFSSIDPLTLRKMYFTVISILYKSFTPYSEKENQTTKKKLMI
jgi:hypothetical protein